MSVRDRYAKDLLDLIGRAFQSHIVMDKSKKTIGCVCEILIFLVLFAEL